MESTQQSRYYQVSGAYPVVEDEDEEDPYLQMMNEIAGKQCKHCVSIRKTQIV